jgi:hypothetical protein
MRTSTWILSILAVEDVPLRRFDLRAGCATPAPLPLPFMVVVSTLVSCKVNLDLLVVVVVDLRRCCESSCSRVNALDEGCIDPNALGRVRGLGRRTRYGQENKLGGSQPPGSTLISELSPPQLSSLAAGR